ncbi:unnamed protein product [Spirodela intermedia]|uniref:Uncharacterized protein n=1 Tax=Spirodela intermedia TaxID=51605 RepID=A0A7I8J1F6_SPIIN|nr:unnamed protein product [Spirodela intermedia]CAA6663802.1 unnamed protein product [Spirodela intermedia]
MAEGRRQSGVVSWFSPQKGFGFIKPDDGGEDLFVHQTSIRAEGFRVLSEGETVEFDVERGDDGRAKAVDVTSSGSGAGGRARAGGDAYGGGGGGWRSSGGGGRFSSSGGGCYSCGESGHLARDCPTEEEEEEEEEEEWEVVAAPATTAGRSATMPGTAAEREAAWGLATAAARLVIWPGTAPQHRRRWLLRRQWRKLLSLRQARAFRQGMP